MPVVRFFRNRTASTRATKSASSSRSRRRLPGRPEGRPLHRGSQPLYRGIAAGLIVALFAVGSAPLAADVIVARNTPHLSFTASMSPDGVKPGRRLSLVVNVMPKKRMHVYAPGTTYRAITVTLDRHPSLKPSPLAY